MKILRRPYNYYTWRQTDSHSSEDHRITFSTPTLSSRALFTFGRKNTTRHPGWNAPIHPANPEECHSNTNLPPPVFSDAGTLVDHRGWRWRGNEVGSGYTRGERERERDRQTDSQTERERFLYVTMFSCTLMFPE